MSPGIPKVTMFQFSWWEGYPLLAIVERALQPRDLAHLPPRDQVFFNMEYQMVNVNGRPIQYQHMVLDNKMIECDNCGRDDESINNWRIMDDKTRFLCNACGRCDIPGTLSRSDLWTGHYSRQHGKPRPRELWTNSIGPGKSSGKPSGVSKRTGKSGPAKRIEKEKDVVWPAPKGAVDRACTKCKETNVKPRTWRLSKEDKYYCGPCFSDLRRAKSGPFTSPDDTNTPRMLHPFSMNLCQLLKDGKLSSTK